MLAFWQGEILDRALVAVTVPPPADSSPAVRKGRSEGEGLLEYWTCPETLRKRYMDRLRQLYLGGDAMPVIGQNHGTSGHCNYYGAEPVYDWETVWFHPVLKDLDPAHITYRPEVLERHLAITNYLVSTAGDDYLVGMPDSCGTLDALAHLYGSENLLIAMREEPEAVARAVRIVNEGWTDSNERYYQAAYACNRDGCAHPWMHLWAPGRMQHMQCDLSVMISTGMYENLVVPELEQQMRWLEYPIYHFDGIEQERHLGCLLSLKKLRAVQWTNVDGQSPPLAYLPVLKRIQAAGKNLILMTPIEDAQELIDNLSSAGLYIHCWARTPEEADALVRHAERNVHE